MRLFIILAIAVFLLPGCQQFGYIKKTECPVVTVPCKIVAPAKPNSEFATTPKGYDIELKVKALLIDRTRNDQYMKEMEAAVKTCQ